MTLAIFASLLAAAALDQAAPEQPAPAVSAPPVASAGVPTAPVATGSVGSWVSGNDYPTAALRTASEGTTKFALTVGADGRVSACEVIASSGSTALDETTCALMSARATFIPAHDSNGQPVPGKWTSGVNWRIPAETPPGAAASAPAAAPVASGPLAVPPPPRPGTSAIVLDVAADGTVSNCHAEPVAGEAPPQTAPALCATPRFQRGYVDALGTPMARRIRVSQRIEIEPVPTP